MDAERFKRVEDQIADIHTALLGNLDGHPGLLSRVDRLEQHNKYLAVAASPGIALGLAWVKAKLNI